MNTKSVACEVERLLAVIGGRWKLLLLRELFDGPRRHGELRRALPGISQKVLTGQLADLVLDGALQREERLAGRVRQVEYSLTPFGLRLRGLIEQMHTVARDNCETLRRTPDPTRHIGPPTPRAAPSSPQP